MNLAQNSLIDEVHKKAAHDHNTDTQIAKDIEMQELSVVLLENNPTCYYCGNTTGNLL